MRSTDQTTTPTTPAHRFRYNPHGLGFAELFADATHVAVPAYSGSLPDTLPSLRRLPYGLSLEQAVADRWLFSRCQAEAAIERLDRVREVLS